MASVTICSDFRAQEEEICHYFHLLPFHLHAVMGLDTGLPGGSDSEESAWNVGNLGSVPGLGRSPGGGHGNPIQHSCLENPHGQRSLAGYSPWVAKNRTWLSNWEQHRTAMIFFFFFKYLVLSWLFHSFPSPLSRGSLVPLHFLPLEWYLALLMFLPPVLSPANNSSSPDFSLCA